MSVLDPIDADALARGGELDAEIGADGVPRRPVVLMRPGIGPFTPPLTAEGARPIVVLLRDGPGQVPASLAAFIDITLALPGVDPSAVDVADPPAAAQALAEAVSAAPRAALALAGLLRTRAYKTVSGGLFTESAVYSMLQGGSEHAAWLARRGYRRPISDDDTPRVRVTRVDDTLHVALTRAGRHNALDLRLRDELLTALTPARWDRHLQVHISGEGATFSSGGDLDEFGTAGDPPTAHLVRLQASLGAVLHELSGRTEVRVHGDCHGAGVELPAFAGHVIAAAATTFRLPEIAMGLIPGAGGTVSLPRRIGPGRTLWLALTGQRLSGETALAWGLIDALE